MPLSSSLDSFSFSKALLSFLLVAFCPTSPSLREPLVVRLKRRIQPTTHIARNLAKPRSRSMEAAAAAIAVITVSLQSTKLIYQTVEEIRNGPAVVAELASRTRKLDALLQQLLDLICHSQRSITTQDQHLWKSLEHEILQCSDYLNKAADKIKKLDSSLSSHPIEKTWRRIKVSLKDKDLERMSEQMQNYVAMLNTQLHIINRYVPFFCARNWCDDWTHTSIEVR